jgi:hypothetical protein
MPSDVMVWDLETIPDIAGFARANNLVGKSLKEIRAAIGDEFPKLIYHSIICIGRTGCHANIERMGSTGGRCTSRGSATREGADRVLRQ